MSEQRRTVTVVFCDLAGSTALGETVDPERLRVVLARYFERMKGIVEHHGGTVEKFIGDAVMAVFGAPTAHEDDALRAVRAAVEMRDALLELDLEGRIGVMTGEVVTGTEERLATGDAVNVAARLEQAAAPGDVLIGEPTLRLVRDAIESEPVDPLVLKGKREPVPAFRVIAVTGAPQRRHDTRFVGRQREITLIRDVWTRVVAEQRCELLSIVGEAGVGKSRLVAEALAEITATVARGRCLPYGEGITYWPVVEVLQQLGTRPPDEAAAAAIRSLLSESDLPTSADEIAWAFRKTLEHAASKQPLVVMFDDIQWGEQTLRDLIEHVTLLSTGAPILLVCMARPELIEQHPTWPVTLRLEPLGDRDVADLIGDRIPDTLRERITHAAGGIPLFVGEMLAMAAEGADEVVVPPNLRALLAARLDQLEPAERSVLESASVEGEVFHRGATQALASEAVQVTPRLAALVRKQLISPARPQLENEDGFRFRHLLIRDATYDGLPKALRADLHERFATWLQQRADSLVELDEILGYHLEQAYRYRLDLGAAEPALGARAAQRLAAAGRAARGRGDVAAAVNLLERSAELLPQGNARPALIVALAEVVAEAGEPARSADLLEEAVALAQAAGDVRAEWLGRIQLIEVRDALEPGGAAQAILSEAEAAVAAGNAIGDSEVLARAWALTASGHLVNGSFSKYALALDRASAYAHDAGDVGLQAKYTRSKAPYFIWGPGHVDEGLRFADTVLERLGGVPGVPAFVLHVRGHMRARQGEFDGALADVVEFRRRLRELGKNRDYAMTSDCVWDVCLWAGDWERGEMALREGYELLEQMGNRAYLAGIAGNLGDAVLRRGMLDEAERLSEVCEELSAKDDVSAAAQWLILRARVGVARGDLGVAEELARRAIELNIDLELPELAADARLALAEALSLAGRSEARTLATQAFELYERKGNIIGAARVQEFIRRLEV